MDEEKHLIPDHLLPPRDRGKGYRITQSGKVYGVLGHRLILPISKSGLHHPLFKDRNVWHILGEMFVPNPKGYKHAVQVEDEIRWISDLVYNRAYRRYRQDRPKALPLCDEEKEIIRNMYAKGAKTIDIVKELGVSARTIRKYKEK